MIGKDDHPLELRRAAEATEQGEERRWRAVTVPRRLGMEDGILQIGVFRTGSGKDRRLRRELDDRCCRRRILIEEPTSLFHGVFVACQAVLSRGSHAGTSVQDDGQSR